MPAHLRDLAAIMARVVTECELHSGDQALRCLGRALGFRAKPLKYLEFGYGAESVARLRELLDLLAHSDSRRIYVVLQTSSVCGVLVAKNLTEVRPTSMAAELTHGGYDLVDVDGDNYLRVDTEEDVQEIEIGGPIWPQIASQWESDEGVSIV